MSGNLSLVIFTVLAQAAAGLSVMLCLFQLASAGQERQRRMTVAYVAALVMLAVGGIASMTHLAQPLRAFNVLDGLAHGSPLSWEIVSVSLFGAALTAVIGWRLKFQTDNVALAALTAVTGLAMVYAISRVYTLHTVTGWDSQWTVVQFFVTTGLLGIALSSVLIDQTAVVRGLGVAAIGLILFQLPAYSQYIGQFEGELSIAIAPEVMTARLVLLGLGALLWFLPMFKQAIPKLVPVAGVVLLFGSELAGRAYFYELLNFRVL